MSEESSDRGLFNMSFGKKEEVDENTEVAGEEHKNSKLHTGLGIAGGILGIAAVAAGGYVAYNEIKKHNEETSSEDTWARTNYENEAQKKTSEYAQMASSGRASELPLLYWVLVEGNNIPSNAFECGKEKGTDEPYFAARAWHKNGIQLGKAGRHMVDGAAIAFGGRQVTILKYEVLVKSPSFSEKAIQWVEVVGQCDPAEKGLKPVEGGHEPDGAKLFVCQAHVDGSVVPGKAGAHLPGAHVAISNDEKIDKHYRLLCYA